MTDLIAINKKYEKIFRILDTLLILAVFGPFVLLLVLFCLSFLIYVPDFLWDLVSIFELGFIAIYFPIGIFAAYLTEKGKTEQVKNFALATIGKCIVFCGIGILIKFVIMLIFSYFDFVYFDWFYAFLSIIFLIFLIYIGHDIYFFEGMFNLKLRKAKKLRINGKLSEALILLNELESENYKYPSLYYALGRVYEDKKEYDKSLEYFNKLIDLKDIFKFRYDKDLCIYTYEHIAYILRELKRYDEALEAIDNALLLKEDKDWSWGEKGYILYHLEKYDEALEAIDKAIELNTTNKHAHYYKAHALIDLKRYDEANDEIESILNIDSKDTYIFYIQTLICLETRNFLKALDYIEKSFQIDHDESSKWMNKGIVLYHMNHYKDALINLKKVLKSNESSLKYIGCCLEKLENVDEAKKYYKKALSYEDSLLDKNKDNAYNLLEKTFLLGKLGKFDEALAICDELLKKDLNNVDALAMKAYILNKAGKFKESLKHYDKALELEGENTAILSGKAWVLCDNEKYEEGLMYINKSLELEPNDFNTLYVKGDALEELGDYQNALKYYDKVLKINPGDEEGIKGRESVLKKIKK